MKESLVFIDEGFLDKLTKLFGDGTRIKFDKLEFARKIAKKEGFFCKHLFYYTCPPYQSSSPSEEEVKRKKGYDKFISALSKNKEITIREGRVQKIIDELRKIINKIGGEGKYTIILEKTRSGILYASDAVDLTDKVIKAHNEQRKQTK